MEINHHHYDCVPESAKYYDFSIVVNIMESKEINLSTKKHEFWINTSINMIDNLMDFEYE